MKLSNDVLAKLAGAGMTVAIAACQPPPPPAYPVVVLQPAPSVGEPIVIEPVVIEPAPARTFAKPPPETPTTVPMVFEPEPDPLPYDGDPCPGCGMG